MELSIVAFFVSCWVNLAWVFASIEDLAKSSPAVQTTVDIKPGAGRQEVLEKLVGFLLIYLTFNFFLRDFIELRQGVHHIEDCTCEKISY